MKNRLLAKINQWHENEEHQEIIDALNEFSIDELNYELKGMLGRAYNNVSKYDKALKILFTEEHNGKNDAIWNFRVAYAYYFKNEFEMALFYFDKSAQLGDDTAPHFKKMCFNKIVLKKWFKITVENTDFLAANHGDWNLLPKNKQELVSLLLLEEDMRTHGFEYFYSNWGYKCLVNALEALKKIGYIKKAVILRKQFKMITQLDEQNATDKKLHRLTNLTADEQTQLKILDHVYIKQNRGLLDKIYEHYYSLFKCNQKKKPKRQIINVLSLNLDHNIKH